MKKLIFALGLLVAAPVFATDATSPDALTRWQADHAQVFTAGEVDLAGFSWLARPVIVFADTANDPRFTQQMELLAARPEELAERDVVVITDTDPAAMSAIRKKLRPRGFMMVLMGKDGTVYLRKPFPWDVREISRSIDKMPLRQQEMEDRRGD